MKTLTGAVKNHKTKRYKHSGRVPNSEKVKLPGKQIKLNE